MEFNFADVERALALTYNVRDDKRSAFSYRLKHLQKLGFPPGINTGRGRAATYTVGHLFLLGVALELNQLGLNPERAVGVIEENMLDIAQGGMMAAREGPPDGSFELPFLLYFVPAGLSDLTIPSRGGTDLASATFHYGGLGVARESFEAWFKGGLSRVAFLSLSTLIYDLASYSRGQPPRPITDFYDEMIEWAERQIATEGGGDGDDPEA